MMDVRHRPESCLNCGTLVPPKVKRKESPGRVTFTCPDCSSRIVDVAIIEDEHGVDPRIHMPSSPGDPTTLPVSGWKRVERWWTDKAIVSLIHGRPVSGDEKMAEFVRKFEEKHGITQPP